MQGCGQGERRFQARAWLAATVCENVCKSGATCTFLGLQNFLEPRRAQGRLTDGFTKTLQQLAFCSSVLLPPRT